MIGIFDTCVRGLLLCSPQNIISDDASAASATLSNANSDIANSNIAMPAMNELQESMNRNAIIEKSAWFKRIHQKCPELSIPFERLGDTLKFSMSPERIGAGNFGNVYKSILLDGTKFAMKKIDKDKPYRLNVANEICALTALKDSNNIVPTIAITENKDCLYILMELFDKDFREFIKSHGKV